MVLEESQDTKAKRIRMEKTIDKLEKEVDALSLEAENKETSNFSKASTLRSEA